MKMWRDKIDNVTIQAINRRCAGLYHVLEHPDVWSDTHVLKHPDVWPDTHVPEHPDVWSDTHVL